MATGKTRTQRARSPEAPAADAGAVQVVKHRAKRKNIPPAGLEAQGRVEEAQKVRLDYNPHLPPRLRFADDPAATDRLPALLQTARERALTDDEARELADALRRHEPWLEWSGKRERPWFEVDLPALHIHERVSTQAMLRVLAREDVERDLFADPQQTYAQAVQFYRHDIDWANRMILGDSLAVMASLARREDLAGKVQMIYIDPPYGISFKSNFQPQLGQRDVKDKVQDLTREPEMVKAYRDTWTLGVHSYLTYLRDRLAMARELLTDSGSVFVQISDENLHRVRAVMDEVFGPQNALGTIVFQKTGGFTPNLLPLVADYILWYGKGAGATRFRNLREFRQYPRRMIRTTDWSSFNPVSVDALSRTSWTNLSRCRQERGSCGTARLTRMAHQVLRSHFDSRAVSTGVTQIATGRSIPTMGWRVWRERNTCSLSATMSHSSSTGISIRPSHRTTFGPIRSQVASTTKRCTWCRRSPRSSSAAS